MKQPKHVWLVFWILTPIIGFILGMMGKAFLFGFGLNVSTIGMGFVGAIAWTWFMWVQSKKEEK